LIQVKSRPSQCTQLIRKITAPHSNNCKRRKALDESLKDEDKLTAFAAKLERLCEKWRAGTVHCVSKVPIVDMNAPQRCSDRYAQITHIAVWTPKQSQWQF